MSAIPNTSNTTIQDDKSRRQWAEQLLMYYFRFDDRKWAREMYELGRIHEREHCKEIAARVRKELDK